MFWGNQMLSRIQFKNMRWSMSAILKSIIILSWLIWAVIFSLTSAINIPTFHLDGAFQTASGLYRLDAGQFPGKDFYPYLGIGPLFSLFPLFKILGGNISASVFSAQFVVLIFGLVTVGFIWHLIWRPRSVTNSLVAGCLLLLMPVGFANYLPSTFPDWMSFQISPGHSLRPIRAFAPYLIFIPYYFLIPHIKSQRNRNCFSGLLTGSILLWSNDFAIPSAGLFAVFFVTSSICREGFRFINMLTYLLTTIFAWGALLAIATCGHPMELLNYNFADVAQDQWWFFGPYDESSRIMNFQQIALLFSEETKFPIFILILVAIFAARTKLTEHIVLFWIGLILFAGGALASFGGHVGGYFGGFYFWGKMVIYFGATHLTWVGLRHSFEQVKFQETRFDFNKGLATNMLLTAIICVSFGFTVRSMAIFRSATSGAANDPNRFYVSELGGYLNSEWKDYIYLARKTDEPEIFEEYWGLWSATRKIFPAWPVDSIIHTLGSTRATAASAIQNAKLIITTREAAYPDWVGWNISQNYWFYQRILLEWAPIYQSPLTTVWRKSKQNLTEELVPCKLINKNELEIKVDQPGLLEVSIQYSVIGFRSLLLLENKFSFSPVTDGFVSLNPNANSALIPAYAAKKGSNVYHANFLPAKRHSGSRLNSCTAKLFNGNLVYGQAMVKKICASDNFYLTDSNWTCGIARRWGGFFVPNNNKFVAQFSAGKSVRFVDGSNREITRVEPSGKYLNIFVDGEPLDPEKIGSPDSFLVIDKQ